MLAVSVSSYNIHNKGSNNNINNSENDYNAYE